jgi:hypothetical protein
VLDEEKKKYLEQLSRTEQESRFHELCQILGTAHSKLLNGTEPDTISVKDFEEYEYLRRLMGFD